MTLQLLQRFAPFVLMGSLFSTAAVPAAEIATIELEEVSDAEKIKWARATTVSVTEAIKTATAHTPGQVIEAALHAIHGRLLYEVEVVTKDDRVVELFVDPRTGKLIPQGELKR
ncbi:MAG: PepSY domain-containing protein [Nitrospirota bacterium]